MRKMNELTIFEKEEYSKLKIFDKNRKDYIGFFYIMEYGDMVKIGSTIKPYQRFQQLKRQAVNYSDMSIGRIAISQGHTNYRKNESELHKLFSKERKENSELFDISFNEVIDAVKRVGIVYEDKSKELEEKSMAFFEGMKGFVLGGIK